MVHVQHVQQQQLQQQQQQQQQREEEGEGGREGRPVAAQQQVQAQPHLLLSDPMLLRLLFEALASEGPVQAIKVAEALGERFTYLFYVFMYLFIYLFIFYFLFLFLYFFIYLLFAHS